MTEERLSEADVQSEAKRLLEAERSRRPLAPLADRHAELTIDDGYRIQHAGIALRVAGGARRVGRKVGLTSQAMQEMLGVDQPDFGVVLDSMQVSASAPLDSERLIAPRVEAEIGFVIADRIEGANTTVEDVLAATSHVCAALEIIDSRIADWRISIIDTIADNASSGRVLLGEPVPVSDVDLVSELATVSIGDRVVTGNGAAVLGHPAEGVAWLARTLATYGEGIEAGEFVIPGAVAAALPFGAGDSVRASYSTLGTLEVRVI